MTKIHEIRGLTLKTTNAKTKKRPATAAQELAALLYPKGLAGSRNRQAAKKVSSVMKECGYDGPLYLLLRDASASKVRTRILKRLNSGS